MSYGTSGYACASYAGTPASKDQMFLPRQQLQNGAYEHRAEYRGSAVYYSVEIWHNSETNPVTNRIYTHNDPFETPQLQVITGGNSQYSQSIIGAARFIVITTELTEGPEVVTIKGREYFQ